MIYLGSDHRGFELKQKIKDWLNERQYEFMDMGNADYDEEDDYPDYAKLVAKKICPTSLKLRGVCQDKGILVCGSGVGVSIAANRVNGVRCGLCTSVEQTVAARKEDDINCLALGVDYVSEDKSKQIVEAFLKTEFSREDKYTRRINKIEIE